ncbi:septal ring lytic transglycosylase RlpA family protein [Actinomadura atramentaria]|uniref:septal ring lytic transglycosylase RlpA family protein n=1 Tax=Actinomadura atramentaria TaxID=1990 RepID=UPI00039ABAFD|nr:septal ring lytic transglycosylase RlpA family protein [Actinomadura atramentaria]
MGKPGRHRPRLRLRTLLIASGAAVAVLALGAWKLVSAGEPAPAPAAAALADAPRAASPTPPATAQSPSPSAPPSKRPSPKPDDTRPAKPKPKPPVKPKKPKKVKTLGGGSCEASFYGEGQTTASGEAFDPGALTAAHKTLPMGSKVRVTNKNNGRTVVVRINDRGPFVAGRCLDLSTAAMAKVGGTGAGVIPVRYEVLSRG